MARAETQDGLSTNEIKSFKYKLVSTRVYEKTEIKIR